MHYGESKRATDQNSPSNGTQFVCYRYDVARTYEGFDFRTPSELCNEMMLKVVSQAADRYFGKWPLHIIQPVRQAAEVDYPPVRITARFASSPIRQDMHLSSLVSIWFQEEPMPVPDNAARLRLQLIDWDSLALDYQW